jgi:hypothetical protein
VKIISSLLLGLSLLLGVSVVPEAAGRELPASVRLQLDRNFPGWHFPQMGDDIRQATKEWVAPGSHLDLLRGDFDGNAELDYALLIAHGDILNEAGFAIGRKVSVVAFLRKGDNYEFHLVGSDAGDYLLLIREGDGRYDYEGRKEFIFPGDSIDSVTFEKAAVSYVYEKGKFRAIITGD